MEVVVVNGDVDRAIRGLRKLLKIDDIHSQVKRRLACAKPSMRRKAKVAVARRRIEKEKKKRYGPNKRFTYSPRPIR